jgi:chromosome segregation ATPase
MTDINADIEAIKAFRDALVQFRYAQRDVADRGDDEIETTRGSLEAKAGRWRARLEQAQAEFSACRHRAAAAAEQGYHVDCSAYAWAVEAAQDRLDHIRRWQQRVEQEAGAFRASANRFRNLLDNEVRRTDTHLQGIVNRLEAARRVQAPGS